LISSLVNGCNKIDIFSGLYRIVHDTILQRDSFGHHISKLPTGWGPTGVIFIYDRYQLITTLAVESSKISQQFHLYQPDFQFSS
jgi:hypothetical protein